MPRGLEGCFAQGHVYVLISRVTDPARLQRHEWHAWATDRQRQHTAKSEHSIGTSGETYTRALNEPTSAQANLALVGLPPYDILEDLVKALRAKALDIDEVFGRAVSCSNEFIYDPCRSGGYRDRFAQKYNKERTMPIKWRSLADTLNPQPVAFDVIRKLLRWIDRCDEASQHGLPAPCFKAEDGGPLFPPEGSEDELWWLNDVKRKDGEKEKADEDGPPDSESDAQDEGADAKKAAELTEDSDPDSPRSDQETQSQGVILPVRYDSRSTRTPDMRWAASARASTNSIG